MSNGKQNTSGVREWRWDGSNEAAIEISQILRPREIMVSRDEQWLVIDDVLRIPMGSTLVWHLDATLSIHVPGADAPVRVKMGGVDFKNFRKEAAPSVDFGKMRADMVEALGELDAQIHQTKKIAHLGFKLDWLKFWQKRVQEWVIGIDIHVKNGQISEGAEAFNEVFDPNAGVSAGVSAQGDTEINYTKPQRWIPPVDLSYMRHEMEKNRQSLEKLLSNKQGLLWFRGQREHEIGAQIELMVRWRKELQRVVDDLDQKWPMIFQPMIPSNEAEDQLREAFENLADAISDHLEFNRAIGATEKQTRAAMEDWERDCKRAFRDYYENKKAAENHDKLDDIQMRELKENLKLKSSLLEAMTSERDGWKKEWELMNTKNREVELAIREVLSDRDAAQKEAVRWESEYRKMEAKWMESGKSSPENPFSAEWSDVFKGHFVVNTGVFPFDVIVSVNETREELMQFLDADRFPYLQDFDKDHEGYDHPSCDAMTYGTDAGPIIMRFKRLNYGRRQMGFLAHEIFHAVEFMLHRLNVPHDVWKTSEVYAYLLQYLTEQIHENIGLVVFRAQKTT